VCEMTIRSGRKYAFGTRNYQQVIEARSQVMAENFLKYSHFHVIEILKHKMVNHLHKGKKAVKQWTAVESIQIYLSSIIRVSTDITSGVADKRTKCSAPLVLRPLETIKSQFHPLLTDIFLPPYPSILILSSDILFFPIQASEVIFALKLYKKKYIYIYIRRKVKNYQHFRHNTFLGLSHCLLRMHA
jgi:hypothetical protein